MVQSCHLVRQADIKWLVILALTCRALRVPAIEVLWGGLNNLIPISRLLPGHFMLMEELHAEFIMTSFRGLHSDCEICATREDHWFQAGRRSISSLRIRCRP
ncbi:hypothetical protein IEO21_10304 [Rhodonia placenta]|uniref:Secreted protein n=1 Tax=Rhodonia placenta TaxID=104341 RepID=A0A8H7NT37_9APHY|nr:hypothetical protein IEO21_10304 [Postia placenta]